MNLKLDTLTDVPGPLRKFYPDLAEFKSEVALYAENSHKNDCLMAKMLTNMTTAEAEATKAEIQAIAVKMNDRMRKHLGNDTRNLEAVIAMMLLSEFIMANALPSPLTVEQLAMLHGTGMYEELLTVGE